jgi:hypothetical protein
MPLARRARSCDTGSNCRGRRSGARGRPDCTLAGALYSDLRLTNGWQSSYALDFDNGNVCAAAHVDSIVQLFESWGGVDLLKLDGFGPGSGHNDVSGQQCAVR